MAATKNGESPSAFSRLSPRISLFAPTDPVSGQLVIICTWLGARKKHIARYTALYQRIAPNARILLIESDVSILISSYRHQREAIIPAAKAVRATLDESASGKDNLKKSYGPVPANSARILLHTFSNGGTNSATQLLIVLNKQVGMPLPLFGLICDSGPAIGTYWKSYTSMVLSLPKDHLSRVLGPVVVHFILCVLTLGVASGIYVQPEDLIRNTLLDNEMVAGSHQEESRICYIYSTADKHVHWTDIVDHGELARHKGWHVKEVRLEDSDHCNHISKYEKQYVEAMKWMWGGARIESADPRSHL